jgi:serine/threonine protein kinase
MIELAPGTEFAGYRLDGLAGRGGMGVVYRAVELALDRAVALKVMAPWLTEDEAAHRRFLRESRVAAAIEHPNVIPIYAAGEHDGRAYIVMRFVEGSDLRGLIRHHGRLPPEQAARIVAQVAAGLDAAHRAGLVHRDVKPANVLLDDDEHVYLTDFGLTRGDWSSGDPRPTESGVFVGTSDYVAPEQIRGGAVDARADVYSLGAVLFHALTGEAPFAGRNHEAILWAHLTEPPPAASRRFDPVIARAMAKRPADRYPSAGDLGRGALAAATGGRVREPERAVGAGAAALDDSSPTRAAVRPRRRRRWPAALLAVPAAVAAAVAVTSLGPSSPPATAPSPTPTVTPPPRGPQVDMIPMGGRTVSLAAAGGRVWALVGTRT